MYSMAVPQELETEPSDELAVPYLWKTPKDSYLTLEISCSSMFTAVLNCTHVQKTSEWIMKM